jgi:cytochrome c-type biogenesis protein CcmH
MAADGVPGPQSITLWQSAAERDPAHILSRFYLAGEAIRAGRYEEAVGRWTELLAMADGSEPWFGTAHTGLAIAEAALAGGETGTENLPGADSDQQEMIRGMVEGLAQRLADEGGSLEEWTRLVRSRLVLGETDLAQAAYDAAVAAHPDAGLRSDLDALAQEGGLEMAGGAQ